MATTDTQKRIQPVDLAAERAALGPALEENVLRVLHSGAYVLGPEVEAFEKEFAAYQGTRFSIGVATGTDALILALKAMGVGHGDEVITTPFTFFASAGAIAWLGAVPRFVDVDPDTALMRIDQIEDAITRKTRAILPVHLYGALCDMDALRSIADSRGLGLLEDAAQAHGAERTGSDGPPYRAGARGHAAAFSFYPTKNLGAAGEGGAILTDDGELACHLARLRDHGSTAKYQHGEIGTNSRLQAIQAAVLRTKLPHLEAWNNRRREIAAAYTQAFQSSDHLRPIQSEAGSRPCYHQYGLRLTAGQDRAATIAALSAQGISAAIHYPTPVHFQAAAQTWGYSPGDFPGAERLASEILCLPVHPFLSASDVERVTTTLLALKP